MTIRLYNILYYIIILLNTARSVENESWPSVLLPGRRIDFRLPRGRYANLTISYNIHMYMYVVYIYNIYI